MERNIELGPYATFHEITSNGLINWNIGLLMFSTRKTGDQPIKLIERNIDFYLIRPFLEGKKIRRMSTTNWSSGTSEHTLHSALLKFKEASELAYLKLSIHLKSM